MNTADILMYGHQFALKALDRVPISEWEKPGVCGVWSVKDIVAHLAVQELVLIDVLNTFIEENPLTPTLDQMLAAYHEFNDLEVEKRRDSSSQEALAELQAGYEKTLELIARVPEEKQRENGALPWYGDSYDLQDFIVYTFYGHKREHGAQFAVFADQLAGVGQR